MHRRYIDVMYGKNRIPIYIYIILYTYQHKMSRTIVKQQLKRLLESSFATKKNKKNKNHNVNKQNEDGKNNRKKIKTKKKNNVNNNINNSYRNNNKPINKKRKIKEAKDRTRRLINEVKKEKEMKEKLMEQNIKFLQDFGDEDVYNESLAKMKKRRRR